MSVAPSYQKTPPAEFWTSLKLLTEVNVLLIEPEMLTCGDVMLESSWTPRITLSVSLKALDMFIFTQRGSGRPGKLNW